MVLLVLKLVMAPVLFEFHRGLKVVFALLFAKLVLIPLNVGVVLVVLPPLKVGLH